MKGPARRVASALALWCCLAAQAGPAHAEREAGLRALADAKGLVYGAAVNAWALRNDPQYREALKKNFNAVTTENALKFSVVHVPEGYYWYVDADQIVEFARENDMAVRGHTLVWHKQLPKWLTRKDWEREELLAVLREHTNAVMGRYRDDIKVWDVVNEAASELYGLRNSFWMDNIGPSYIEEAFRFAHEAHPEAVLFYNDYNAEGLGRKSDVVYEMLKGLLAKGVPVHGVGLQLHVGTLSFLQGPGPDELRRNIRRLADLGLEVHITEIDVRVLDVPVFSPVNAAKLAKQAEIYGNALQACLDEPGCTAFITWGVSDKYSWVPGAHPGFGRALIFDEDYRPKPAWNALYEILARPPRVHAGGAGIGAE